MIALRPELFRCTNIHAFERIVRSSSFWASHSANMADQKEVLLMRDRLPATDWRKSRCDLLEKPPSRKVSPYSILRWAIFSSANVCLCHSRTGTAGVPATDSFGPTSRITPARPAMRACDPTVA